MYLFFKRSRGMLVYKVLKSKVPMDLFLSLSLLLFLWNSITLALLSMKTFLDLLPNLV